MPFDLQPTLIGNLVELRPLREDDRDVLYAAASDPLIWEQHPEPDRWTPEGFGRYFQGALDSGGAFLIRDRRTGQVIGSSRFHGYDESAGEIEIGWTFLVRSHWGGAYNREVKQLMLRHAFRFVGRVTFVIGARNLRSQKAIERIGAVRAGVTPHAHGEHALVYAITPDLQARADRGAPERGAP